MQLLELELQNRVRLYNEISFSLFGTFCIVHTKQYKITTEYA